MRYSVIASVVLLAGCVTVSPVIATSGKTYSITVVSHSRFRNPVKTAMRLADKYCDGDMGINQTPVVRMLTTGGSSVELDFSCYERLDL